MFDIFAQYSVSVWVFAAGVALLAGAIKGVVGFALPMIFVSGLGMVFPPEVAIAGLIMPTLVTNITQGFAQGPAAAMQSLRFFKRFLMIALVVLILSALFTGATSDRTLFLLIGVPITLFTLSQLMGWEFRVSAARAPRYEAIFAIVAGFFGGLAGIWGPPTVAYLTSRNLPKDEQIRVQGVTYGLGAVALLGMHWISGVFNASTAVMSIALVIPAMIGLQLGGVFRNHIDQALFKKLTLLVLCVAGLNLLRRALMGF